MIFHKTQTSIRNSLTMLRASMHARGVWHTLILFCAEQETSGRIEGAHEMTVEDCRLLLGCTRADLDIAEEAGLCEWESSDLVVQFYDVTGQGAWHRQCDQGEHGKEGGRPSKGPKNNRQKTRRVINNQTPGVLNQLVVQPSPNPSAHIQPASHSSGAPKGPPEEDISPRFDGAETWKKREEEQRRRADQIDQDSFPGCVEYLRALDAGEIPSIASALTETVTGMRARVAMGKGSALRLRRLQGAPGMKIAQAVGV